VLERRLSGDALHARRGAHDSHTGTKNGNRADENERLVI
jgi:hypothetical protein